MVKIMKKWTILLISILSILLAIICTIAGTYAVVINVVSEEGIDKIVNEINIKDLLTNDDGTYNSTYYTVKNELNVNEDDMNILMSSKELNNNLQIVLNSVVNYKLNNKPKLSNDEIYNLIVMSINEDNNINNTLKNKVINKSNYYKQDISDFIYDLEVLRIEECIY